jgi:hypothetical protein
MELKLSNIWENLEIVIEHFELNDKPAYKFLNNFLSSNENDYTFSFLAEWFLGKFCEENEKGLNFRFLFDYDEVTKISICEAVKIPGNSKLISNKILEDLDGQIFDGIVWDKSIDDNETGFVNEFEKTENVEIVNLVFDEAATVAKADGDTIIVATLSDDRQLTYYIGNNGNIEYIEEDGEEQYEKWLGKFDLEVTNYFSNLLLPESEENLSPMEIDDLNYQKAVKKLCEKFKEAVSGGADWSVRTWIVKKFIDDEIGWYICDDENGNFDFLKRISFAGQFEFEVIYIEEAAKIDELIKFVSNYDFNIYKK